jgi:hypothetical protein
MSQQQPNELRDHAGVTSASNVISVSTFRSRAQAQEAKRILDEAGIESIIQPDPRYADPDRDSRDGRYPHSDYAQVMVRAEDVDNAVEALSRHKVYGRI